MNVKIINLGMIDYLESWNIQKELLQRRINNEMGDVFIILEHPPVITIGKTGKKENVLADKEVLSRESIKIFYTDRGGDVTLHCPGQIVVYPIINLKDLKCDLHWYMKKLEHVIISLMNEYCVHAFTREGLTGVWTAGGKIASIGIGVREWVTFHGVSLNVSPDLKYFSYVKPCGLDDVKMTSMEEFLKSSVDMEEVKTRLMEIFVKEMHDKNDIADISFNYGLVKA